MSQLFCRVGPGVLAALGALGALVVFTALASITGCRDCGSRGDGTPETTSAASGPITQTNQKAMPTGLLSPSPVPDAPHVTPTASPSERLAIGRGKKNGEWSELQTAPPDDSPSRTAFEHWRSDSRFLSLDAMTLLHDPFARALPGFDLFLPRLFDSAALEHLRAELEAMKIEVLGIATVHAAKVRWGRVSSLVRDLPDDAAWMGARTVLVATMAEIITLAAELAKNGQGLWVLGI